MAAAAPAQLSGLANQLLRRPPSLRELVTLVGYADDYAWFVGLVRRLFPQEAEAALSAPDVRGRVERFANLFGERHFPLYAPFIEFWTEEEGEQPPWSWLRQGIPFDLMGFGYDGLHEMWDGYREGSRPSSSWPSPPIPPTWQTTGYGWPGWSQPPSASRRRHWRGFPRAAYPWTTSPRRSRETRFDGAAQAASWVFAETGNFFLDHTYEDGNYDGFSDPWDDDIIKEGTEEWRKASALMDSVGKLTDWLEEDIPGRFAEMLDFVLGRLPNQEQEDNDHD